MGSSEAEAFLNTIASDVSVADHTRAMTEHPEWLPARAANPRAAPAPEGQVDAVLEMSGLPAAERERARQEMRDRDLGARVAAHDVEVAGHLLAATYTTQGAADLLERDPSNIRRGVQAGCYHAVRVADRLRLPEWQFVEEVTVAPLDRVGGSAILAVIVRAPPGPCSLGCEPGPGALPFVLDVVSRLVAALLAPPTRNVGPRPAGGSGLEARRRAPRTSTTRWTSRWGARAERRPAVSGACPSPAG